MRERFSSLLRLVFPNTLSTIYNKGTFSRVILQFSLLLCFSNEIFFVVDEIHIALLSCSIDIFSIQAFTIDKSNFAGKWEIVHQEVVITLKKFIGRGSMRMCYTSQISNLPKQFDGLSPNGWVAKVDIGKVPGNTCDLCRKVSVWISINYISFDIIQCILLVIVKSFV